MPLWRLVLATGRLCTVSPRPVPTRYDATAGRFLNAAAQLIDASLVAEPARNPPRLRSLHYPAALDWIRIEDVLRLSREINGDTASKRAFANRWSTKDDFIQDAIIHALLYRDHPSAHPDGQEPRLDTVGAHPTFSAGLGDMVDALIEALMRHPRSYLLAHIAPLLPRHPELAASLRQASVDSQSSWTVEYPAVLDAFGIKLRPDWPAERVTLAVQIILDGTLVRSRVEPDTVADDKWRHGSIYADTVLALVAGVIDVDASGQTVSQWLDAHLALPQPHLD